MRNICTSQDLDLKGLSSKRHMKDIRISNCQKVRRENHRRHSECIRINFDSYIRFIIDGETHLESALKGWDRMSSWIQS